MTLYKKIIVASVALLTVGSLVLSVHSIIRTVPTSLDVGAPKPTIIIDAGHGGIDGGAVGVGGEVEKEINLAISLTLRDIFLVNGYQVVMTRETDISIHDEGAKSVKQQKTSDLHNRLALVESYPNAVFLSVHQNKFGDRSSKGTQVFYSPNNPQSENLAKAIQTHVVELLQPENKRENKKAGKNLYLMYNAKCPAVLVECGFLSNPEEVKKLSQTEYQNQMALTIFYSVVEYLTPEPEIPQAKEVLGWTKDGLAYRRI